MTWLCLIIGLFVIATSWMEEGFTDGIDNSRYTMWQDEPKPDDELETKKAAEDVKCKVCEVILQDLLQKARKLDDEDNVLNVLESEALEAEINAAINQRDTNAVQLAQGRSGCNRHFKDSYLRLGWDVEGCKIPPPSGPDGSIPKVAPFKTVWGTCTMSGQTAQNETKMNTYSRKNEAVFWACQLTVGNYKDEMASFIVKKLSRSPSLSLDELAKSTCEKPGKCLKNQYQGTYADREKEAEKKYNEQQQSILEDFKLQEKEKERLKRQEKKQQKSKKQANTEKTARNPEL